MDTTMMMLEEELDKLIEYSEKLIREYEPNKLQPPKGKVAYETRLHNRFMSLCEKHNVNGIEMIRAHSARKHNAR